MKLRVLTSILAGGLALLGSACNSSPTGGTPGSSNSFSVKAPTLPTYVKQGDRQTVTLTLSRGSDFKKAVTLEVAEPNGVKAKLADHKVTADESAEIPLTIEADKDAPLGDHVIKITATPESGTATSVDITVKVQEGPKG